MTDRPGVEQGAGDASFQEWYTSAYHQLLFTLVAYCGEVADAEDALAEACARAYWRWDRVSQMGSPSGWTFVVAKNELRRTAGRRLRHRQREGSVLTAASPEDQVATALEVASRLTCLTPRQRQVAVLHYGLDLSQETVAELLGISRSTVATTLRDARSALSQPDSSFQSTRG